MAQKERIELHFHSKFGGNGTLYPGEMIRFLSELGMPAFAITDESNIGAFPEMERVWEYGNYSARPIFGMEVMAEREDQSETDFLSVLIRNETGKRAIYRLVSKYSTKEILWSVPAEELFGNREGLLIGSGTDRGPLYKMALAGAKADELKELISAYDYVEVLPGEQYEDVNRVIIYLCEELGIPVVAVSDARYIDFLGKYALKIMHHSKGSDVDFQQGFDGQDDQGRFLNTEEMLSAFDYLSKEKAYEIVVENTYRIAEQCEIISVVPKEKYYPVVENAEERLRTKCFDALESKYAGVLEEVTNRLEIELHALHNTGMESSVLQMLELMQVSKLKPEDISLRGTAAGSIVLYLLDLTEIDPLKYHLAPELIYGSDGTRELDIDFNFPIEIREDVIKRVSSLEGVGKYVWAGTSRSISDSQAETMILDYMEEMENLYSSEAVARLRWMIAGNYLGKGRHPGGVIVYPDGYNYMEESPISKYSDDCEVSYFDYHKVDDAFLKYDLLAHVMPEILGKLSGMTGVGLKSVPVDSQEALDLFQVDENGNTAGCQRLPEFRSSFVQGLIQVLKPKTFDDVVKVAAISHDTNAWLDNGDKLVEERGLTIKDLIATRDDVFDYNIALGLDRQMAFDIAEGVRKGIIRRGRNSKWKIWKEALVEAGAPDWYIWSCEQILYLFPRAHCIEYVFMNLRLGWFMVHFPREFDVVMKEYEEKFI